MPSELARLDDSTTFDDTVDVIVIGLGAAGASTAIEARMGGADVLILSCRNLIRVDFSAAGTLLNWVSNHHAQNRLVQFVDVHRLVSAFFHVIGITEYAKVVLRND